MKPQERVCSQCLSWRRTTSTGKGLCYQDRSIGGKPTRESSTCQYFEQKVLRVVRVPDYRRP